MRWSSEETALLLETYNSLPNEELVELFPKRTFLSIYKKAKAFGLYKSKSLEYVNRSRVRSGERSANWKGGRKATQKGYVVVLKKGHRRADANGYVMEHILVFENATGIEVPANCVVHHLNGNKADNRIENLCLMEFGAHTTYHNNKRWSNNE